MKFRLSIFLLFINLTTIAQNYSTIKFLTRYPKANSFTVYINDRNVGVLKADELFNYKIYSEGRLSIILLSSNTRLNHSIDVKNGNTYYLDIYLVPYPPSWKVNTVEDAEKGEKLAVKMDEVFEAEEDIYNPVGKVPENAYTKRPSQGTGFLINDQGYVLTNFHVVEDAKKITVSGIHGDYSTKLEAKIVAIDHLLDLAVIHITSKLITFKSPPYSLGLSSSMKQGDGVFALGYPIKDYMGEEIKVTDGIINSSSGYKGSISEFQFSAAVQPGNSGGPLLNKRGEVIGVVSSKLSPEFVESAGYAIKSDYINFFLNQIPSVGATKSDLDLSGKELSEQVHLISDYVFILETE